MKRAFLIILAGIFIATACWAEDDLGLPVGTLAPDFQAATYQGEHVRLFEFTQDGPVILVFYRGGWCPYCNRQLQELQLRLEDFKEYGASLIAVSVDRQQKAAESVAENSLSFTVISDPAADLLKAYNIVYQVPEDLAIKYKEEHGIDLQRASGRADHIIAVPAAFVVDRDGTIVFSYVNEDYTVRVSPDELLEALESLTP